MNLCLVWLTTCQTGGEHMDNPLRCAYCWGRVRVFVLSRYLGGHCVRVDDHMSQSPGEFNQDRLSHLTGNVRLTSSFFCASFFGSPDSDLRIGFEDSFLGFLGAHSWYWGLGGLEVRFKTAGTVGVRGLKVRRGRMIAGSGAGEGQLVSVLAWYAGGSFCWCLLMMGQLTRFAGKFLFFGSQGEYKKLLLYYLPAIKKKFINL